MSETSTTLPAPSKKEILRILREKFPYLQEQYGITRLALYGSYIRMEPHPESDIDLMVEFSRPLGLRFVDLAYYLEDKLGLRVDLATSQAYKATLLTQDADFAGLDGVAYIERQ